MLNQLARSTNAFHSLHKTNWKTKGNRVLSSCLHISISTSWVVCLTRTWCLSSKVVYATLFIIINLLKYYINPWNECKKVISVKTAERFGKNISDEHIFLLPPKQFPVDFCVHKTHIRFYETLTNNFKMFLNVKDTVLILLCEVLLYF